MYAETNNDTRLKVAAVQMDANPAPTIERLERAERLVAGAVEVINNRISARKYGVWL